MCNTGQVKGKDRISIYKHRHEHVDHGFRFISASARELGQYAALMAGIIEGILKSCQFVSRDGPVYACIERGDVIVVPKVHGWDDCRIPGLKAYSCTVFGLELAHTSDVCMRVCARACVCVYTCCVCTSAC